MKLNIRRTALVGFAFMSICAFWQLYDGVVPLVLKNNFGIPDGIAGVIMAMDNVFAVFLLPFFGTLSDRCRSRLGKRTPFIITGTALSVILMNLLPVSLKIRSFALFIAALALLLVAMGVYRSPAVALMPDVTPKPLRSKANAIINLMGAIGGVFTLAVTTVLVTKNAAGEEDYTLLFAAVSVLMVIAVAVLVICVREKKLTDENQIVNDEYDRQTGESEQIVNASGKSGFASLKPEVAKSLVLILLTVFFCYMGYNAVSSALTKFFSVRWGYDIKTASQCMMVAVVGAVVSYIPVGLFSAKLGRKNMVRIGAALLSLSFLAASFIGEFTFVVYIIFAVIGLAWAIINVNTYPMVVEISGSGDVGKFTGYYYTFSMSAQIVTPILSGFLLQYIGYSSLLPYAALMAAIAFVMISFVKHGDARPAKPKSVLEAFDVSD
ncbi:MAG: MFS transporter [Eubacteriales bacterium]|nr:MFS transporter [Eubacteriales bacterium]MDD3880639.1 MFS transporter [Eubacteriales bacterium]MDD4513545.1 MFS transporter [Eubacteriales bacterium]